MEDDIAALGPVVVRDELAARVIDQSRFTARLDAIEHLPEHGGLAAARRPDHRHVASLESGGDRNRTERHCAFASLAAGQFAIALLGRNERAGPELTPDSNIAARSHRLPDKTHV